MYLKEMFLSTKEFGFKIFSDYLFYIGGALGGYMYYLTGLSVAQLQSVLLVIFLDIGTRIWAEYKNKRVILSRKMFYGFAGKFASYMILFILAQHSFYLQDIFQYAILGGFSLIEFRSIYENLKDAGQKHLQIIGERMDKQIEDFTSSTSTTSTSTTTSSSDEATI